MVFRVPSYYKNFRCIADKCPDNCCRGWEIDIDEDTLDYYKDLKGPMAEKIRASISEDGSFVLNEEGWCPLLNEKGLCEVCLTLGEDSLSEVCTEYPRFTTEYPKTREKVLHLGISQISGGSRTSVGGYVEPVRDETTSQFDVSDTRSLDEVVNWLIGLGYIPSFCTACYRAGRTGDRFMSLLKSGQIVNCCQPNALMTLKEYLEDYASEDTKKKGEALIAEEILKAPNENVRNKAMEYLKELHDGKRDFRF